MKISGIHRRPLGATRLHVPPIVFGTAALGNVPEVIPEQRKLAICGEWFRQIEPPVFVDVAYRHGDGLAVEVLGRMLRRLDIAGDDLAIHLTIDAGLPPVSGSRSGQLVVECWEKSVRLLGDAYVPKLVSIANTNDDAWSAAAELKSAGRVLGVGVATRDLHTLKSFVPAADWALLSGVCTIMRQDAELRHSMAELAGHQIPIVVSGVFGGGFLVGGNSFEGRRIDANDPANRSLLAWRMSFAALCHGHGVTPAHVCIQFALSLPGVVAVKLNPSYPDRVAENVAAAVTKIPDAFWQSMKEEGLIASDDLGS